MSVTCVQQFISDNYDYLSRICVGMVGDELGDDLMHDLCVTILEDNGTKYVDLCGRGELMYYLLGVIRINAFSKNTRFYYKYRKHKEHETGATINWADVREQASSQTSDEDMRQRLREAKEIMRGIPWFEAEVFKIYYLHNHSLQTLSDATGISKTTINKALGRARHKIKRNKAQRQQKQKASLN